MNSENCAEYIWELENFISINEEQSSPIFTTKNSENEFYLYLLPKNYFIIVDDYARIQVHRENETWESMQVQCTFSLLNRNNEKCFTKDILSNFKEMNYYPGKIELFEFNLEDVSKPENELLHSNGTLRIHCELKVLEKEKIENIIIKTNYIGKYEIEIERSKALKAYESLLKNCCKYSDVIFVVGKEKFIFKLHKAILSARSPVFAAMFDLSENKQNRVEIPDVEVEVFEELVLFIYTGKLFNLYQFAWELLVVSVKCQMDSLSHFCKKFLDGNLEMASEAKVLEDVETQPVKTTEISKALDDYESLLKSCKHSDVLFVLGKKEFKLHKAILSARSPVFAAMFDSDLSENKLNRIEISDVEVEVFEELLPFIYSGTLPAIDKYTLELFVALDKYQFESIKEICELLLGENLSIETLANVITIADMHSAQQLKSKCAEFFTKNAAKVMKTEAWKEMAKTKHDLVLELLQELATKAELFL